MDHDFDILVEYNGYTTSAVPLRCATEYLYAPEQKNVQK